MKRAGSDDSLRCSFCAKSQDVVGKLISSPSDYPRAYICDECIAVCNSILEDDRHEQQYGTPHKLPKPLELKEYLDQAGTGLPVVEQGNLVMMGGAIAGSGFEGTEFGKRVAQSYASGAGWLFAADMEQIERDISR